MNNTDMMSVFASKAFNDTVMLAKLPPEVYQSLKQTIREGKELDSAIAEVVAGVMKDWAVENGATHYCHWFIPMTGSPAEKHNSFLTLVDTDKAILEFSGKNLIKGESDASSFPSGGLRATFEARGYTAWDCTSPAFIRNGTLCIPTIYCSYNGEALDKKTPLLRSMEAISNQSLRLLHLLGEKQIKRVFPSVGAEQEYFLIDEKYHSKRLDLKFAGKTLFGKMPPKGQEMDDHYYGDLNSRVADYMADLDIELWKLAITSKTKHNEVAPAQHELAPIHEIASVASDRNHLTMEVMKRVAKKHGLVCMLNEKPFEGVNGSGKHNNWSLITNEGENLFKPGKKIKDNLRFLLFVAAVVRSVDIYSDLLYWSISSAGNDCRLGGHEAPPRIISIFLGDQLTNTFKCLTTGEKNEEVSKDLLKFDIKSIPSLHYDASDRNRTSPFAFTGDKFEFRMPGSSASIADCNTVINTAVSESLDFICTTLEKTSCQKEDIVAVLKDIFDKNGRVIFNGDGYTSEWQNEAKKRGLKTFKDTVDVAPTLIDKKNSDLFEKFGIFSKVELTSRYEVTLRVYNKIKNIEAKTMIDMAMKQFLPSANMYLNKLLKTAKNANAIGLSKVVDMQKKVIVSLTDIMKNIHDSIDELKKALKIAYDVTYGQTLRRSTCYRDYVDNAMQKLRSCVDELEDILPRDLYPVPSYVELLFGIN